MNSTTSSLVDSSDTSEVLASLPLDTDDLEKAFRLDSNTSFSFNRHL